VWYRLALPPSGRSAPGPVLSQYTPNLSLIGVPSFTFVEPMLKVPPVVVDVTQPTWRLPRLSVRRIERAGLQPGVRGAERTTRGGGGSDGGDREADTARQKAEGAGQAARERRNACARTLTAEADSRDGRKGRGRADRSVVRYLRCWEGKYVRCTGSYGGGARNGSGATDPSPPAVRIDVTRPGRRKREGTQEGCKPIVFSRQPSVTHQGRLSEGSAMVDTPVPAATGLRVHGLSPSVPYARTSSVYRQTGRGDPAGTGVDHGHFFTEPSLVK